MAHDRELQEYNPDPGAVHHCFLWFHDHEQASRTNPASQRARTNAARSHQYRPLEVSSVWT